MTSKEMMTVDGESYEIVRSEPMGVGHTVADVTDQTERGLALFEERVRVAKRQLAAALKLTQPGQWVVMDGGDGKQGVYATAGAADRILRMGFGMRWGEKTVKLENTEKALVATCEADLLQHDGRVYERFHGVRRGVYDADSKGGIKGYLKNESDLIKGAIANMKHSAVQALLGLTFLTPADLAELGLDLAKLPRRAEYQDHGEQGAPQSGAQTVPFGKNKGKAITELEDKSLAWYIGAAQDNIKDPAKSKWKAKEEKWLAALVAERERRITGDQDSGPGPDDMPPFDEPGAGG